MNVSSSDVSTDARRPGYAAYQQIAAQLDRTDDDRRPVVVMTCGISGAGKSTLSKCITAIRPNFTRLSIDAVIYNSHGLYGIDYPAEAYAKLQNDARQQLQSQLTQILHDGHHDIVLDLAFWNKDYRDEYKAIIERGGGRWILVYLNASRDVLWRNITARKSQRDSLATADSARDGDCAFEVTEETFEAFLSGFKRPIGEGEIVSNVQ